MSSRRRLAIFGALLAVCVVGAVAAIAAGIGKQEPRVAASAAARRLLPDAQAERRPMLLVRSLAPKGQLAVAPLGATPGHRTFQPLSCDRVYFAAGRGICLQHSKTFPNGLTAKLFASDMRVTHQVGLTGIPSRARVSPDGRYGAVTAFVAGDSYAAAGSFSTRTTLIDLARGTKLGSLEQFTVTRNGRQVTAVDVNFWGVTFARDSDRFYATLATAGKTYLIQGSVSGRTAHVIHDNVECPSLSPDGKLLAYKKRTGPSSAPWHLTVLDLATMRETPLAETRSVDDQVEWLDGHTLLYGVDKALWAVPADGSGRPRRFLTAADSPAVIRW
jgi:hypothetical protein